jgi:hypothetical protein
MTDARNKEPDLLTASPSLPYTILHLELRIVDSVKSTIFSVDIYLRYVTIGTEAFRPRARSGE